MNDSGYISLYPNAEVTRYKGFGQLTILRPERTYIRLNPTSENLRSHSINETTLEILGYFNGENERSDIVRQLHDKYGDSEADIEGKIDYVVDYLESQTVFKVVHLKSPRHQPIEIIEYNNRYPLRASIELTNQCNMACRHCYGSYGSRSIRSSTPQAVPEPVQIPQNHLTPLFASLSEAGIISVEMTGGELSIYPYATDAIEAAFANGIEHVTLLTNGAVMSPELLRLLAEYAERMTVQIDLHSLDSGYYEWFTGMPGVLDKVLRTIDAVVATGVKTILGSIITPGNISELEELAAWSYEHGAHQFSPSLVVDIGRARHGEKENLMFVTGEDSQHFVDRVMALYDKYPDYFVRKAPIPDGITRVNCGTVHQHVTLSPTGEIKLCAMATDAGFDFSLGNAFEHSIRELYDENCDLVESLITLKPPDGMKLCFGCCFATFCHGCIARGLSCAAAIGAECRWYRQLPPSFLCAVAFHKVRP